MKSVTHIEFSSWSIKKIGKHPFQAGVKGKQFPGFMESKPKKRELCDWEVIIRCIFIANGQEQLHPPCSPVSRAAALCCRQEVDNGLENRDDNVKEYGPIKHSRSPPFWCMKWSSPLTEKRLVMSEKKIALITDVGKKREMPGRNRRGYPPLAPAHGWGVIPSSKNNEWRDERPPPPPSSTGNQ
jgi:hypothetical protein